MFRSMFSDGTDQVSAKRQSIYLVCLVLLLVVWLSGCTVIPTTPNGIGIGVGYGATTGNSFGYSTSNVVNNNQSFNGCPRVCNGMGVCTSNPALYPQMARSGAVCVPGNSNNNNSNNFVPGQTNNNQTYNCKSGGTGTREQCLARDAGSINGNININNNNSNNFVPGQTNNNQTYNCKSGGTGTREQCLARDAGSVNNGGQEVACKSGGTQRTIHACQQQDLQLACAQKNYKACDILKKM